MAESSTTIPLSRIELLNSRNYDIWSLKLKAVLKGKQLFHEVIEREEPPTGQLDTAEYKIHEVWRKKNDEAFSILVITLSDEIAIRFTNETKAKNLWEKLREFYTGNIEDRRIDKTLELKNIRMKDNETVDDYLSRAQFLASQCATLGHIIPSRELVFHVVRGLPPKFENVALVLRTQRSMSLEEIRQILKEEEEKLEQHRNNTMHERAFSARAKHQFKDSQTRNCYVCGKVNHIARDCWYRKDSKYNGSEGKEQHNRDRKGNWQNENKNRQKSNDRNHQHNNKHRTEHAFHLTIDDESLHKCKTWSIDSACTKHMTNDKNWLINTKNVEAKINLAGDEKEIYSEAIGDVRIQTELPDGTQRHILIKDVLYVPDLRTNLLSVSSLTEKGNAVTFNASGAKVTNDEGDIIAESDRQNGLYILKTTPHLRADDDNTEDDRRSKEDKNTSTPPVGKQQYETSSSTEISPMENVSLGHSGKLLWHKRMCHLNFDALDAVKRDQTIRGLDYPPQEIDICEDCIIGKMKRTSFKSVDSQGVSRPLELLVMDICGPMPAPSLGGSRYILVIVDVFSHYVTTILLRTKDQVADEFEKFSNKVETYHKEKIKAIRTDNGGEFISSALGSILTQKGIAHQLTVPYSPESNGIAERMNQTIISRARTILLAADLPLSFWGEAIMTATYVTNRSPTKANGGITPLEKWSGIKPSVSYLKVFGCTAYRYVTNRYRSKFGARAIPGIFVGYSEKRKAFRIYDPETGEIFETHSVKFNERRSGAWLMKIKGKMNHSTSATNTQGNEDVICLDYVREMPELQEGINERQELDVPMEEPSQPSAYDLEAEGGLPMESQSSQGGRNKPGRKAGDTDALLEVRRQIEKEERERRLREEGVRRSQRIAQREQQQNFMTTTSPERIDIPTNYEEAVSTSCSKEWKEAMLRELESMQQHTVWELVPRTQADKVLKSRWVFTRKTPKDGQFSYKARLVAVGTSQRPGIDFGETYSPVVKKETFRLLMAIAAQLNMKIKQFDIKTAYLYADLDREIFMEQPPGFAKDDTLVCKLKRSIYGLQQSGHCWNITLDEKFKELGLIRSHLDPCVYTTRRNEKMFVLGVYVDDILVISEDAKLMDEIMGKIGRAFELKEVREPISFIGMEITQEDHCVKLSQKEYIQKALKTFGMEICNPSKSPGSSDLKIEDYENSSPMDRTLFQKMLGTLMYLSTGTRPDISFQVHRLAAYSNDPREIHLIALKRIYRYLKGTSNQELVYRASENPVLRMYSDASWSSTTDSRSITGYIGKLGDSTIVWKSQKQGMVAMSSCEAELTALSEATKEEKYICSLLNELGLERFAQPTVMLYTDSRAAVDWLKKEPFVSARTKHFNRELYFVREEISKGPLSVKHIPAEDMQADFLTKSVTPNSLEEWKKRINLI